MVVKKPNMTIITTLVTRCTRICNYDNDDNENDDDDDDDDDEEEYDDDDNYPGKPESQGAD